MALSFEDLCEVYTGLLTDRLLTQAERAEKLADFKANLTHKQYDKVRRQFFDPQ